MNNKKSGFVLMIAIAAVALGLTACKKNEPAQPSVTPTQAATEAAPTEQAKGEETPENQELPEKTKAPSNTKAPAKTEAPAAQPKVKAYTPGTLNGNTYKSDFCGLDFSAPVGWGLYTEEQISQYIAPPTDTYRYEMVAVNPATQENVMLMVEKVLSSNMTAELYAKQIIKSTTDAGQTLVAQGKTRKIGDGEYYLVEFTVDNAGTTVKTDCYLRVIGDRGVCIMAHYAPGNEGNIETVLNAF